MSPINLDRYMFENYVYFLLQKKKKRYLKVLFSQFLEINTNKKILVVREKKWSSTNSNTSIYLSIIIIIKQSFLSTGHATSESRRLERDTCPVRIKLIVSFKLQFVGLTNVFGMICSSALTVRRPVIETLSLIMRKWNSSLLFLQRRLGDACASSNPRRLRLFFNLLISSET